MIFTSCYIILFLLYDVTVLTKDFSFVKIANAKKRAFTSYTESKLEPSH